MPPPTPVVNTTKATLCTITLADTIAVFRTFNAASRWASYSGAYADADRYGGITCPVTKPGIYQCMWWTPTYDLGTVYIKEYDTPQVHPNISFPYTAWAVTLVV